MVGLAFLWINPAAVAGDEVLSVILRRRTRTCQTLTLFGGEQWAKRQIQTNLLIASGRIAILLAS